MFYDDDIKLKIAKSIGEPISSNLPVPVEITEVANIDTAEVGEKVYRWKGVDDAADVVLDIAQDGSLTEIKREPIGDTLLNFKGLNSKKEHVLMDQILAASDNVKVLARRKASIIRSMDKKEVYAVIQGVKNASALGNSDGDILPKDDGGEGSVIGCNEIVPESADDIYDVIMAMKHKIEDYGDNYVLLAGSTVKERIDNYSKDNAVSHNYNVDLNEMLRQKGIEVMKIYGKFSEDSSETEVEKRIMEKEDMILLAKNSRIDEGKPITFVRRKISAQLAELMGAEVDNAYRLTLADGAPVIVAGNNTFGYSVWGYESLVMFINNPYAIAYADCSNIL